MANNEKRPPMGGHGPGGRGAVEKSKDFKGTTKKLINDYYQSINFNLQL